MRRKGQFYMIDAFFAAVILFAGIGFIVAEYVSSPQELQTQTTLLDISDVIYSHRLADLSTQYIQTHYDILDERLTPIEQAHVWAYNSSTGCAWCLGEARLLLESVLKDLVPPQFGAKIELQMVTAGNLTVFNKTINRGIELMIVNQQVIVSQVNDTFILGPDVAEVSIWR